METYKVVKRTPLMEGRIVDVVRDRITLPNGKEADREVVKRGDATAIVPVDSDGNIIFVRQYRHPAEEQMLEIPAGMLEEGEDPLMCALRELEEETAYKSKTAEFLFKMYSAVGFCNEILYIYLTENLEQGQANPDPDEFVTVEKYSLDQAIEMIYNGEIRDSKTIAGIFCYKDIISKRK